MRPSDLVISTRYAGTTDALGVGYAQQGFRFRMFVHELDACFG